MTYPCRFIFVHFNAWEFVGSDILWAGIVTNLAGAIEDEFGIMTSRIFRLLNVDVIHNDASSNESTFSFDAQNDQKEQDLKEVLTEYGVVKQFKKEGKMKEGENIQRYMVEYSNQKDAANAFEAMKSNGIIVTKHPPTKKYCPLFGRFCKHFTKHPKTTLCLPNLCWLLLFCSAFVCLLFIIIQAAKALNIDIKLVS